MHTIKRNMRGLRGMVVVLGASALLAGCGLVGGGGNLARGATYESQGKYRAAYIEAKKVLRHDDKNADAWLLLGRASLHLGNPKDALNDLKHARDHGVPEAKWAVPTARALLVTGQYDKVLKSLPSDSSFKPKTKARLAVIRGDAELGLKQFDAARKSYQAALAIDARDPRALVGLAKLAAVTNDPAAARKNVQQALAAAPDDPEVWVAKADLAFARQDFSSAEKGYQKALDFKHAKWLPQERFYALARLANSQAEQGQLEKALGNIKTLQKMAPDRPYPHYLHAVVLYKQGHLNQATSQLQQVLKVSSNNAQAELLAAAVNYAQGNYSQSEMYLSNVMGVDPGNVAARKLQALTLYREGRSRQALATLKPAVSGSPTDAQLLAMLQRAVASGAGIPKAKAQGAGTPNVAANSPFPRAAEALASGNASEAIRLLKAAKPADAAGKAERESMLVMAYARAGKMDEAVRTAAAYASKNPDDSAAHLVYGTALVAADKRKEARAQYVESWKLDPKNFNALLNLARLDTIEGHLKDAAGRYHEVLKKAPKNVAAMVGLGQLAAAEGDKAKAIKQFKQAIAAVPNAPAPYMSLVLLYSQGGQFDEATDVARQLVKAVPHNPAALNTLGAAELNAGHHKEALAPLEEAVKLAPRASLYRTNLARAQLVNKQTDKAESNLETVVKADPAQTTAVSLLAFLKLQKHDLPGALALAEGLQKQTATQEQIQGYALEGDLYMVDKSYRKAADAYQRGLHVDYTRPLVVKRFQALSAAGDKDPESGLNAWLAKHPNDAAMRLLLAQYYLDHTQSQLAAAQYERVLKKFPSNVGALNNLAWIYTEQHNPKALTVAERAYKLAPTSASVMDTYAWALVNANRPKTALPILTKAVKAAPKVSEIRYHLAVAQARSGDRTGALGTLKALLTSGGGFSEVHAAEQLYRKLGGVTSG